MAQEISISAYVKELENDGWGAEFGHPITKVYTDCLISILIEMRRGRRKDFYSAYAPSMHLETYPVNRRIIGEVLYFIWCKCQENMLPEINYLVINKRTGYPGKAMKASWVDLYGTDDGYEEYCDMRAAESKLFLDKGWVVITP